MTIRFRCQCGKKYRIADEFAGKHVTCHKCNVRLVVPEKTKDTHSSPTSADELELMVEAPPPAVDPQADFGLPPKSETLSAGELEHLAESSSSEQPQDDLSHPPQSQGMTASEMELLAEPPPPAVDPQADFGHPSKPEESDTGAVELPVKTPPPSANLPDDASPPEEAQTSEAPETSGAIVPETTPEGEKCGKCGAILAADALLCVECGTHVAAKMPVGVVKKKKHIPVAIFVGLGLGLLLLASIIVGLISLMGGGKEPEAPKPTPQPPRVQRPSPTPTSLPPTLPPVTRVAKTPEPDVAPLDIAWQDFDDPALAVRDRLREIGDALKAYELEHNAPASSFEAAEIPAEKTSGLTFVPPENSPATGLRPVAYQNTPNSDGILFVLFHDGTVRDVDATDLPAIIPQAHNGALLPARNIAFIEKLAPILNVLNRRFAEVETLVDGEVVGTVKMDQTASYPIAPGNHQVSFRAKGMVTEPFNSDFVAGLSYEYALPRFQDIPVVDLRMYRRVFGDRSTDYTLDVSDPEVAVIKNKDETIRLPRQVGRASIATDFRSMYGTIERKDYTIVGLDDDAIYVNSLGVIEEGEIRYLDGRTIVFRRTPLETVRISKSVNLDAASVAMIPKEEKVRVVRSALASTVPLEIPERHQEPMLDFSAFDASFAETFSGAVQALMRETEPPSAKTASSTNPAARPDRRPEEYVPPPVDPGLPPTLPSNPLMRPGRGGGLPSSGSIRRTVPTIPRVIPKPQEPPKAPKEKLFAMLAVYGSPTAGLAIDKLVADATLRSEGYSELLLAQARCSGRNAVIPIKDTIFSNPVAAALALATIEDPTANEALADMLRSWPASRLDAVAKAFPDIVGPGGRRRLVEAWFVESDSYMDDSAYLNALLKIDPYIVERELAVRLLREEEDLGEKTKILQYSSAQNLNTWRVLARYRHPAAVQALLDILALPDSKTRQFALLALGETRDPTILPYLKDQLKSTDKTVAIAACAALVRYGNTEAVTALSEGLPEGLYPALIVQAVPDLAERADPDHVADLLAGMLVQALAQEKANDAEKDAKDTTAQTWKQVSAPVKGLNVAPASSKILFDALVTLQRPAPAVMIAVDEARHDPSPEIRVAAYKTAVALNMSEPEAASKLVIEGLNDEDLSVRSAVMPFLTSLPTEVASPALEIAVVDLEPAVRRAAMETVVAHKLGTPDIVRAVSTCLGDTDPGVLAAAAEAAAILEDSTLGPPVAAALKKSLADAQRDSDEAVQSARAALIHACGVLRDRNATPSLDQVLNSPRFPIANTPDETDDRIHIETAHAMGVIGDASAVPGLARALHVVNTSRKTPEEGNGDALAEALLTALTQYDTSRALEAWAPWLSRGSDTEITNGYSGAVAIALKKLVSSCGAPGIYQDWVLKEENVLPTKALYQLADLAKDAPPEWTPGLILIGKRYFESSKSDETLLAAASLLAHATDDPAIQTSLVAALEKKGDLLAEPVANMFRKTRAPQMVTALKDSCRAIDRILRAKDSAPDSRGRTVLTQPSAARGTSLSLVSRDLLIGAIAEALGHIGSDDAVTELGRMSYTEESPELLEIVIEALVRTKSPESLRYLSRLLRRTDQTGLIATYAFVDAAEFDPAEAASNFSRLTKGSDPYVAVISADGWYALDAKGLLEPEDAPSF